MATKEDFNILYMNIRSIKNKCDELNVYLKMEKYDLIALTEVWLHNNEVQYYNLQQYASVHSCRNSHGGGVSFYVREDLQYEILDIYESDNINSISIKIDKIVYSVIYRAPSSSNVIFLDYIEQILCKYKNNSVIIGDMNINLLNSDDITRQYKQNIEVYGYKIINQLSNEHATRIDTSKNSSTIIDHVLSNCNVDFNLTLKKDTCLSDHKSIEISMKKIAPTRIKVKKSTIKKLNVKKFQQLLIQSLNKKYVETFEQLSTIITDSKNKCQYEVKICGGKNWINEDIIETMKLRDKKYVYMKKHPDDREAAEEFNKLKNKTTSMIRAAKKDFFYNKLQKAENNPRKVWKVINSAMHKDKVEAVTKIIIKKNDYDHIGDQNELTNYVNDYFINSVENLLNNTTTNINPQQLLTNDQSLFIEPTNENEIIIIVNSLKEDSAPGCDNITVLDIKKNLDVLLPVLVDLYNKMLETCQFPEEFKIAKVTPVFKSGDKTNIKNYRPISLLTIFSKIAEKLIKRRLETFITNTIGYDKYQYGFVKDRNTEVGISDFVEYISERIDNGNTTVALFVDFSKAFDTVHHDILLRKLENLGIRGMALTLLETYINNRRQFTMVNDNKSELKSIKSGVPQGSVLGPTLYNLYVMDIQNLQLKARYFSYADDTVLVYSGTELQELEVNINEDLDKFVSWTGNNKLVVNASKTKFMTFKQKNKKMVPIKVNINNKVIDEVETIKYLGVWVDNRLSWKQHIQSVEDKLVPLIGALYRCRDILCNKTKKLLYHAHIQSHLNYNITTWGNATKTLLSKLQRTQNKCIKSLYNIKRLTPTNQLYNSVDLSNVETILRIKQSTLIYNIVRKKLKSNSSLSTNNMVHNYITRAHQHLRTRQCKTNIGKNSTINSSIITYNNLPSSYKEIKTINGFKRAVKNYYSHKT